MSNDTNGWAVLLWDGKLLYGVFGPFATEEAARTFGSEANDLRAVVVPLWKPESED